MSNKIAFAPLLRLLIGGACVVVIISGLRDAAAVVNPLLIALLVVPMILPVQQWLIERKVSRSIATALTVLVLLAALLAVVAFVGTTVAEMARRLPTYAPKLTAIRDALFTQLQAHGVDTSTLTSEDGFDPQRLMGIATQAVKTLGRALSDALFVVLMLAFALPLLGRNESIHQKNKDRERAHAIESHFADMRKYVGITALCGLLNGVVALGLLLYLRIDFALTWAVLFFLMNFVPAVGFVFALIPPVLLALVQYGWSTAIIVAVVYTVVNFIVDSVLKPRFMAEGLDLSPLVVIVALVFWSWVLGPIGAIMAVPITMVLRKLMQRFASEPKVLLAE